MANTYVDYTAVASQTDYNFSFEYLRDDHVKVKVNDVIVTNYTIVTSPVQLIRFDTAPTASAEIRIYRDSRGDFSPLVDFEDGSVLTQVPLDEAYRHNLFVAQEASEGTGNELLNKKGGANYDAEGNKIINLGSPTTATDAATKSYVDQTIDNAELVGGSPATVSLGVYDVTSTNDTLKQLRAWTADIETGDKSNTTVTATGSTTARSLKDRFADVINVLDYGALNDGTDPSADNHTNIQAALDNANGKPVYFPKGIYAISSPIVVKNDNQTIYGDGDSSEIKQLNNTSGAHGITSIYDGLLVRDIKISSPVQIGNECEGIQVSDGANLIQDVTIQRVSIINFSYSIVCANAKRFTIKDNYCYCTANDGVDEGGAFQFGNLTDSKVLNNVIEGDASNRFQHGMYLSGDISNTLIDGNIIRDGFYSYGFHIYGVTFTTGRNRLTLSNNIVENLPNALIISSQSSTANDDALNVTVKNNYFDVDIRCVYLQGDNLNSIEISSNRFESGGNTAANRCLELDQSGSDSALDLNISNNTFKNFKSGAIDLGGAVNINRVLIKNNTFIPDAPNLAALLLSATPTSVYDDVIVIDNRSAGTHSVIVSSTYYDDYKNASWMRMDGNDWDKLGFKKQTAVSGTSHTLGDTEENLIVDPASATTTINLPTIADLYGRRITVTQRTAGTVVIDPFGTQTIGGTATHTLSSVGSSVTFESVPSVGWVIL